MSRIMRPQFPDNIDVGVVFVSKWLALQAAMLLLAPYAKRTVTEGPSTRGAFCAKLKTGLHKRLYMTKPLGAGVGQGLEWPVEAECKEVLREAPAILRFWGWGDRLGVFRNARLTNQGLSLLYAPS